MSFNKEKFINQYAKIISKNNAAVFLGSGINAEIGLPTWKSLLNSVIDELDLTTSENLDLPLITQFYINQKGGSTKELLEKLDEKLNKQNYKPGKNLRSLVKLPIQDYWTTNYDILLEKAMCDEDKPYNVIYNKKQFYNLTKKNSIFKIHGDISNKEELVLWKDSYDLYEKTRKFFWDKLSNELINKSFLFIGTALEDPNLYLILSKVNILLKDSEDKNEHFIILQKIQNNKNEDKLKKLMMEYKIKDLEKRFNIKTILVDSYEELSDIFSSINKIILQKNIFISGAAEEYGEFNENEEIAKKFLYFLSNNLCKDGNKIISGFGKGVGDYIISGAIDYVKSEGKSIDDAIEIWPFPQSSINENIKKIWTEYRNKIIDKAGVTIFLFGNKIDHSKNEIVFSNGMLEEFEIAKSKNKIIIPIGSTGYASKKILKEIESNISHFNYLKSHIDKLKTIKDENQIFMTIKEILKNVNK